jgi:hypothetical protein
MKSTFFMLCLISAILLLATAVPVSALDAPSISSVNPAYGYNGASVKGVVITGTGFNVSSSPGKVRLMRDGESNITATVSSYSTTSLTCTFPISGAELGEWDVVVVNRDLQEDVLSGGFTIKSAITLTSVSPTSAQTNDNDVAVTVVGIGLSDIDSMYLYNEDYENILADITSQTSTKVIGTFDLDDTDTDFYDICVEDSVGTIKCGLDFEIVSDHAGSIEVTSSPSGAKIYLDSTYMGTTPTTLDDVSLGSHKILISKTGFNEWSKLVTVTAGATTTVNADLNEIQITTVPTVLPTTVKTPLKANTVKVPTPWPTNTATQTTSVEPLIILGAVGMGFVILRKQ